MSVYMQVYIASNIFILNILESNVKQKEMEKFRGDETEDIFSVAINEVAYFVIIV